MSSSSKSPTISFPNDDDLINFQAAGAAPLPQTSISDYVENEGAKIWYGQFKPNSSIITPRKLTVVLLHGGNGHSGNWGFQVPYLLASGYDVITIDSRGHGRSTRDSRPYNYELMARDVTAVLDKLKINREEKVAIVGWSDGACTALITAMMNPERVSGVFFFACNMDPSGTKEDIDFNNPLLSRCFSRHIKDYEQLSPTPDKFEEFSKAVEKMMETEPNYTAEDLQTGVSPDIRVAIVQSENDEFIKPEHAEYLSKNIPRAELIILPGVSHFAPLQRPNEYNSVLFKFLSQI